MEGCNDKSSASSMEKEVLDVLELAPWIVPFEFLRCLQTNLKLPCENRALLGGCLYKGSRASSSFLSIDTYGESKYGGIAPKKPLISKDHERAYFDSADWVLGKQAENGSARAAIESLKPKLKRTPHHQLPPRKPTCASS